MKLDLPSNVSSKEDLKSALMEIQRYAHWFGQTQIKQAVSQQAYAAQPGLSAVTADLMDQWHAKQALSQRSLDELAQAIQDLITKSPSVAVTLAAPAPAPLREAIVNWFRQNVNPDMLIDFSFNATMLGGMAVRYGSHVYDWSFKRQILANRAKFPEVLRRV